MLWKLDLSASLGLDFKPLHAVLVHNMFDPSDGEQNISKMHPEFRKLESTTVTWDIVSAESVEMPARTKQAARTGKETDPEPDHCQDVGP